MKREKNHYSLLSYVKNNLFNDNKILLRLIPINKDQLRNYNELVTNLIWI